jgi:hypothetical protein
VNIYFWLFAGILFKLPYLAPEAARCPAEASVRAQRLRALQAGRHRLAM